MRLKPGSVYLEATVFAYIVVPTVATEPRKLITIRLDSNAQAVSDPIVTVVVSVIRQAI